MKVEDHSVISGLPDGSKHDIPTMYTGVESWKDPLYPSKRLPSKLDDYLNGDISPITIHIVSFENATLLTLAFPHVVMDAVAASYLLKTWAAVVADRRHEIPPFMQDGGKDLVKAIIDSGKTPSSKHSLSKKRLTGTCFPILCKRCRATDG